jgi:hypothetical protein
MSITRRNTLSLAPALAAVTGTPAFASGLTDVLSASSRQGQTQGSDTQRFRTMVVHRDSAAGEHYFATLAIRSPDTAWVAYGSLDSVAYGRTFDMYRSRGYRLRRVSAFATKDGPRYSTIWQLAGGPAWDARHDMTAVAFKAESDEQARLGRHLTYVDVCSTASGPRHAALWEAGSATQTVAGVDAESFRRHQHELAAKGYRPTRISAHVADGAPRFTAAFAPHAGKGWVAEIEMTVSAFTRRSDEMSKRGYVLTDVSGYAAGRWPVFSAVWEEV